MHMGVKGDTLYVADYLKDRIHFFSRTDKPLSGFGSSGTGPGEFDAPSSATVDASGRIYVADFYNQRIQIFTDDGSFLTALGSRGTGTGEFEHPTDMALDRPAISMCLNSGTNASENSHPLPD